MVPIVKARAVIGANFGDEGKGLLVDYLCATQGAGMVVRHSGGANAGHTVVTPGGRRHVFQHVGAGAFQDVPTFLSQFFTLNPLLLFKELTALQKLGVAPAIYAHPQCKVTTFGDMIINQRREDARGKDRHGSTGVGVNETFLRSQAPGLDITMADLWNGASIEAKLAEICGKYALYRTGKPIPDAGAMIQQFMHGCQRFAEIVNPLGIGQCREPIFEGSQGLLLDQDNKQFFPHVTRTHTGMRNVRLLCAQAGIAEIEPIYVSRTYLTRHGAGPLPGEDTALSFDDDTNTEHSYQGRIRFADLDVDALHARCAADAGQDFRLALTHCDQRRAPCKADLYAHGPTYEDVTAMRVM